MTDDKNEEQFDIFNENQEKIGVEKRSVVHRKGLRHRSVHILIFNSKKQILIQKRSLKKDVCPDYWDLSCAEHLKVGEDFIDAAKRGLKEELNIDVEKKDLKIARDGKTIELEYKDEEKQIHDLEFNRCFFIENFDGMIQVDNDEVVEAKFVDLIQLKDFEKKNLTAWFVREMKENELFID